MHLCSRAGPSPSKELASNVEPTIRSSRLRSTVMRNLISMILAASSGLRLRHMSTKLTAFDPVSRTRRFWTPQPTSGGIFSFPGLDVIGNAGQNTYRGPAFFNTDLALTKAFTIHENVVVKLRMDAFNVFNRINAGNPNNDDIFGKGVISSEAPGAAPRQLEFALKLQF